MGRKTASLRQKGILPAVLYGPTIKTLSVEVDMKQFDKVLKEAGESSLATLEVEGEKGKSEKYLVLIHEINRNPISLEPIHADFYQPNLEEEVEVSVPIILEGESPAVRELGGTLVRNISEVEVRAKPQDLPKEIRVSAEKLITFEDHILIKDLPLPGGVRIMKDPDEIVALATAAEKVEEELQKPIEEKVEEVEKVEKKSKVAEEGEETAENEK